MLGVTQLGGFGGGGGDVAAPFVEPWTTWDEASEAGLADDDTVVCFAENPSASGNEVGQGGGLSEALRTWTQHGDIPGATGTPPYRQMEGAGDYFYSSNTLLASFLELQPTWTVFMKIKGYVENTSVTQGVYTIGGNAYNSSNVIYARISNGATPYVYMEIRKGGSSIVGTSILKPTNGSDLYFISFCNGIQTGWGWRQSSTRPTKLSDFTRSNIAVTTCTYPAGAFSGLYDWRGYIYFGGGCYLPQKVMWWGLSRRCLIDTEA